MQVSEVIKIWQEYHKANLKENTIRVNCISFKYIQH